MKRLINPVTVAVAVALAALAWAPAAGAADAPAASQTDRQLIRSALSAAPKKVGAGATIVAAGKDGKMRTLQEGSNGYTCMPDNPATPGPDPMCMDRAAFEWAGAWMERRTPATGKVGLMYMLAGGTDASNTDPYATSPGADKHWVKTGAHVMIVGAEPGFYEMYPKTADPDTSMPYVMWPGTPYQHLMVPVK
jgi:Ni/Co efflux regulator RcnB